MATKDNAVQNPYHYFLRLVWKLRKAQKDAKRNARSRNAQLSAESLEREVDKWLDQCGFEAAKIKQLSIIPEDGQKAG